LDGHHRASVNQTALGADLASSRLVRSEAVSERVELAVADGVAEVRLNRPEKLNALDFPLFDLLVEAGQTLASMQGLRAIVLSGNGRSFSVGIDLDALASGGQTALSDLVARTHGDANLFQRVALQWRDLPVPVIAAIQGHALGGGMQLALGADIRIVASDAKLSIREIAWGLIPDMAGTVLLRKLVRPDVMRDLLFSGRIVTGEEALELGLATRLAADPLGAARELAREIAASSPDAVRAAKRLTNAGAGGASDRDMLLAEAAEQQALLASFNHREALRAHTEKRTPVYRD
jgi:enoyl-CoA hydratase/carnithine racemase